jgi:hypothetical protein
MLSVILVNHPGVDVEITPTYWPQRMHWEFTQPQLP